MQLQVTIRASLLFVVLVVLGLYARVIHSPLNPIDDIGIYQHLLNSDVSSLYEIFAPVGSVNYYRPILWFTFWIDKYVWGLEESFMHLENMLIHLANSLLVFALARKACNFSKIRSNVPPLVGALLFGAHPINAEAVNWIAGRTDLLAGLFLFLSLLLLMRSQVYWATSFFSALCLLLAFLVKETAVFFLPAAVVLPFFIPSTGQQCGSRQTGRVGQILHALLFITMGGIYFAFRRLAFALEDVGVSHALSFLSGGQSFDFFEKLLLVLKSAGFYLKKLLVPFPLNFGIVHVSDYYLLVGLFVCVVALCLLKNRSLAGFFFLSTLAVGTAALIIPLLEATWTPLAERYMYIPSAFFVIGMILWLYPLLLSIRLNYLVPSVVVGVLIVFIYGTAMRTLLWQDNLALFQDTLQKSPSFMPAKNEIVNALYELGRDQEAIEVAKTIVFPQGHSAHQLGIVIRASAMAKDGDVLAACALLEETRKDPGAYEGRILERLLTLYDYRLMSLNEDSQELHAAMASVLSRLHVMNGNPFYLYRLGKAYLSLGDNGSAKKYFWRCAKQAPLTAHYYQAALKLSEQL